jgi:tryptophan 2,3-dioxygenase
MSDTQIDPKILEKIELLQEKFKASGQDMISYLEGLLYADYLTYWEYINLDTLLSLQQPKTSFKDEKIFIIYHQITELYFKLIVSNIHYTRADSNLAFDDRFGEISIYFKFMFFVSKSTSLPSSESI